MRIARLKLQNWKNFSFLDVEIRRNLFIYGTNGSGKSNLLDAVKFLGDIAGRPGLQKAAIIRGKVPALLKYPADPSSDVNIAVTVENDATQWEYILAFGHDKERSGYPEIHKEIVRRDKEILIERPTAEDKKNPDRLRQTYLENTSTNEAFREFANFLKSIQSPSHVWPEDLWQFLHMEMLRIPRNWLEARVRYIQQVLDKYMPDLKINILSCLVGKHRNSPPLLSDGTSHFLNILWTLVNGKGPLILEEPEQQLHPGIIEALPRILAHNSRQLFVSTHAPKYLCRDRKAVAWDEIFLLYPLPENATLIPVSEYPDLQDLFND